MNDGRLDYDVTLCFRARRTSPILIYTYNRHLPNGPGGALSRNATYVKLRETQRKIPKPKKQQMRERKKTWNDPKRS